jgi:hypothetical protein
MAVTIEEMHVDVQPAKPEANASAEGGAEPKKDIDLDEAVRLLHERKMRLRAD